MRLALTLGLALLTTCWMYCWSVLIGLWAVPTDPRPLLSSPSILLVVLCGALVIHATARRLGRRRRTQLVLALCALAIVLLVVSVDHQLTPTDVLMDLAIVLGNPTPPALAFAVGLFLWWRGVQIGIQTPTFSDVDAAFRWGIGLLAVFGLILGLTTRPSLLPSLESTTTPFVVGFFFVALLTLALARLESLRTRTRALAVNGQWLAWLAAVAALTILIALFIAQLVSFDTLREIVQPFFDLLGLVVVLAIYVVVIPLAYVVQFILYFLLSLIHPETPQQPPQPLQPTDIDQLLRHIFGELIPPEAIVVAKAAGAALLVGIALLVVARAVSHWRATVGEDDAVEEERESVWSGRSLRAAILAWLQQLFRRRRAAVPLQPARAAAGAAGPLDEPLSSVRALYRQLLRLGASAGASRNSATTPFEHLPILERSLEPVANLEHLTQAYVRARYGEAEPESQELERARRELDELRPIERGSD